MLPTTVYTPEPILRHPAVLFREMGRDLLASRELAWRLFVRNTKAMYRQTALGYVWAFLPPLMTSAIWILINKARVLSVGETNVPYPVYVLVGTLLWQSFVDAIHAPLRLVQQSTQMLTKINFPREALLVAAFGEVLFNFCIRLVLLVGVLAVFRIPVHATILLAPLGVLALMLLGMAVGILLTPLGMLYHDVQQGVSLIAQPWFYLTPIIYPVPAAGLMAVIARVNPVTTLLATTRELMTTGELVSVVPTLAVGGASVILLFGGWVLYRIAMPHLIARLAA